MPVPLISEPLNFPLNFTWTPKAAAKAGAHLLTQGDYDAIELRTYENHQTCHGCSTKKKAKKLVVVRERLTQETVEIGLECMGDLYGINVNTLTSHAVAVASARRSLRLKLGLTGDLSTEQQIKIVREAVKTYVPVPDRLLNELDQFDIWDLSNQELDRIRNLHQLAQYHREWNEDPDHAERRWTCLRGHPAFVYSPKFEDVRKACTRALGAGNLLPEQDIIRVNGYLREAAGFKHKFFRLVVPEDFPSLKTYTQSLEERIQRLVQIDHRVNKQLHGERDVYSFNAIELVSLEARSLYASVAVWEDQAEAFAQRLKETTAYWKKGCKPMIVVGPPDHANFPEVEGVRINFRTGLNEDYIVRPAWTFRYRRVAWALVEPHTVGHSLLQIYGRDRLERYS